MLAKFLTKSLLPLSLALSLYGCQFSIQPTATNVLPPAPQTKINNLAPLMKLSSPNFENNAAIPPKYTCQGLGISPQLNIIDVPEDAKSLALIIDDPDAPSGNWNHWIVWNIPAETKTIPENADPKFAIQGNTSAGKQSYGAPCPPSGVHRYFFKLYALSKMLDLPATSNKADLEKAMEGFVVDETQLMGTYKKA